MCQVESQELIKCIIAQQLQLDHNLDFPLHTFCSNLWPIMPFIKAGMIILEGSEPWVQITGFIVIFTLVLLFRLSFNKLWQYSHLNKALNGSII